MVRDEIRRVLGDAEQRFEVDGVEYLRSSRDPDVWYAVVGDVDDGRPRLQEIVTCERCETSDPQHFAVREDDEGKFLVPQRSRCDLCVFRDAAVPIPMRRHIDLSEAEAQRSGGDVSKATPRP